MDKQPAKVASAGVETGLTTNAVMARERCQACGGECQMLLDAGLHPVATHFLSDESQDAVLHRLALGLCESCGLVQLITPVPPNELVSNYDWITYNEPELHLDTLAGILKGLVGDATDISVAGLTYKDKSTLDRLVRLGVNKTWHLDPVSDLGLGSATCGIESIQDRVRPEAIDAIIKRRGRPDMLIVRHVLEHAYDLVTFVNALRRLVKPGGYLVFEVPDCTLLLNNRDYTMLWEEHLCYFTPSTFRSTLEALGLAVVSFESYPYPYENSLVAILRTATDGPAIQRPKPESATIDRDRAIAYASELEPTRTSVAAALRDFRRRHGRIALFGAGHLACMFVNIMGVADCIDFVIDDHPSKQGLLLPGSKRPIRSSSALKLEDVALCLSTLSPESEDRVAARWADLAPESVAFASIFPTSKRAFPILVPTN